MERKGIDKAGKDYWDKCWEASDISGIIDPRKNNIGGVIDRAIDKFLRKFLRGGYGKSLLEVGCGNSAFLPYLKKEFGYDIYGLDYSEIGCSKAKKVMEYYGVEGKIILGDMFYPPKDLINKFDVVFSMGVIEHFRDTKKACMALNNLTAYGGVVITEVPNFARGSLCGKIQKLVNRDVYDKHVPLSREIMQRAHEKAGFRTLYCDYTIGMNFGVVNFKDKQKNLSKFLIRLGKLFMYMRKNNIKGNRSLAPYIFYVGINDFAVKNICKQ